MTEAFSCLHCYTPHHTLNSVFFSGQNQDHAKQSRPELAWGCLATSNITRAAPQYQFGLVTVSTQHQASTNLSRSYFTLHSIVSIFYHSSHSVCLISWFSSLCFLLPQSPPPRTLNRPDEYYLGINNNSTRSSINWTSLRVCMSEWLPILTTDGKREYDIFFNTP